MCFCNSISAVCFISEREETELCMSVREWTETLRACECVCVFTVDVSEDWQLAEKFYIDCTATRAVLVVLHYTHLCIFSTELHHGKYVKWYILSTHVNTCVYDNIYVFIRTRLWCWQITTNCRQESISFLFG